MPCGYGECHCHGIRKWLFCQIVEGRAADRQFTERESHLWSRIELNDWDSYLLNNISVKQSFRRTGVGTALIDEVAIKAASLQLRSISLHVWADNLPAIKFYKRIGFKPVARVAIPWNVDLPHEGGSPMFRRRLQRRDLISCSGGDVGIER